MSFVYAKRVRFTSGQDTVHSIHVYGDTRIELAGAVKANWPPTTRRAVRKYGISKIAIPCPTICIAFAGNNILYASQLFSWMERSSPFEIDDLIDKAYALHLKPSSRDDIEFIICTTEGDANGRIVCIKNGELLDHQGVAWIGSQDTLDKLQSYRHEPSEQDDGGLDRRSPNSSTGLLDSFAHAIRSSADESVGGYVIQSVLINDEFHFGEYLYSSFPREQVVKPESPVSFIVGAEDNGYTVHAYELGGYPCLQFHQIQKAVLYSNALRYEDETLGREELRHFYLPILFDPTTNTCLAV